MNSIYVALGIAVAAVSLLGIAFQVGRKTGHVEEHLVEQDDHLGRQDQHLANQDAEIAALHAKLDKLQP